MLEVIKDNPPQLAPGGGAVAVPDMNKGSEPLKAAIKDSFDKTTNVDNLNRDIAAEDSKEAAEKEKTDALNLAAMDELFTKSASEIFRLIVCASNINRSWLRPELFYDDDLQAAPAAHISPSSVRLAALMDPETYKDLTVGSKQIREEELQLYSTLPRVSCGFLLAANVGLEISGETYAIQSHFDCQYLHLIISKRRAASRIVTSTLHPLVKRRPVGAGECRITIKSPQIISWISQIVPALLRLEDKPNDTVRPAPRGATYATPTHATPASHVASSHAYEVPTPAQHAAT
ncbi:hypothetical protein EW145_g2532 [Phellinidium pouzarii]|uniref:Uncharacterized protein n=1 Tax=Phellinidium pouzarii TaxID=167371 RepID=A0A4S4LC17_9AGAM|nr:hypothetical protein EW145_g2532 [Phellinidium pouzarii]